MRKFKEPIKILFNNRVLLCIIVKAYENGVMFVKNLENNETILTNSSCIVRET